MRISDWSSDVCSSDLPFVRPVRSGDTKLGFPVSANQCEQRLASPLEFPELLRIRMPNVLFIMTKDEREKGIIAISERDRTDAGNKRSEEHTSELQSLMRISYAVFCLQKKTIHIHSLYEYDVKRTQN